MSFLDFIFSYPPHPNNTQPFATVFPLDVRGDGDSSFSVYTNIGGVASEIATIAGVNLLVEDKGDPFHTIVYVDPAVARVAYQEVRSAVYNLLWWESQLQDVAIPESI